MEIFLLIHFVDQFIKSHDGELGFDFMHPQNLPGSRQDGSAFYFFHKTLNTNDNRKNPFYWQKIGKNKPVELDGTEQGFKKVFCLYMTKTEGDKPEKTNWVLHQYHIGKVEEEKGDKKEGELVVSKLFYKLDSRKINRQTQEFTRNSTEVTKNQENCIENKSTNDTEENGPLCCGNSRQPSGNLTKSKQNPDFTQMISYRDDLDQVSLQDRRTLLSGPKPCSMMDHKGTNSAILDMAQEISSVPCITDNTTEPDPPMEGFNNHATDPTSSKSEFTALAVKSEPVEEELPLDAIPKPELQVNNEVKRETEMVPLLADSGTNSGDVNPSGCSSISFSRPRKRKKTATDSVGQALEEDAPGLLKVLLDRGITVEEIKLYGAEESEEALEISSDSEFGDLESVITKLFPERTSLLQISLAKPVKGQKAVYCLACLISLIEQARYLCFRNSPVEWGWCRDLQSFIFVFKTHNRIVLERPEYGYATYFFEIIHSMPIDWQIKRLVTAMKLNNRSSVIENKPLLVGEDLTEGEASVLEGYGWIKNSGLGTMLNYRDRVVHDKRNEQYSSEWRVKIGRLLMNGYNSGCTVLTNVPSKVSKYVEKDYADHDEQSFIGNIKLEYSCE